MLADMKDLTIFESEIFLKKKDMTKKDLFRLIIKIFGLYWIVLIFFTLLPNYFSFIFSGPNFQWKIWLVISVLIILSLFLFLIYKTDKIIAWLKLDQGFDEDRIDFQNFNPESILNLALIILGGMLILNNVGEVLSHSFVAFKVMLAHESAIITQGAQNNIKFVLSILNIVIGYLFLKNYPVISKFLLKTDPPKD